MNTADYLLQNGDGCHTALIAGDVTTTYQQLRQAVSLMAYKLRSAGIQSGDPVGILGENSPFWAASYLGSMKIGAVAVPFSTVSTADDLLNKLNFSRCKAVCVDKRSYRRFSSVFTDEINLIFDDVLAEAEVYLWEDSLTGFDINQDASLMFTSGTTAFPRAVRVTHRNIQANTDSIIQYLELSQNDRMMVVLPFFYCFGTSLLHTHLRVGGSLVFSGFTFPEVALNLMESKECTGFAGVPSTFQTLLRNSTFPRRVFKSLRKIQQAGGKLHNVLIKELKDALPYARLYVMYGQTEAAARLSYLPPELLDAKLGSIGRGIPGVTLRVVAETGKDVEPGEIGEIYARGDNISPGYLYDPQTTAEKFVNGELRTGDLATVDKDGYIYIVDRKSDFIKSFGHRVSSQEIESSILKLQDIVAAAAIGEPDLKQGEAIKVFVTLRKGAQLTEEDILTHCRQGMAHHMVPNRIIIVDSLPMNAHGKVIKAALRNQVVPE